MRVFQHHIYEYKKGLRNLILHTIQSEHQDAVESKLKSMQIDYQIYPLNNGNINVFFGATECVDVIKAIGKQSLKDYTYEEDFILGTMLGYDRLQQCRRYLKHINSSKPSVKVPVEEVVNQPSPMIKAVKNVTKECA